MFCDLRQSKGTWGGSKISVGSDRTRRNGLRLHQGRFGLEIKKKKITERVVKHWNRLPVGVVESPLLGVLKRPVDVLGDRI